MSILTMGLSSGGSSSSTTALKNAKVPAAVQNAALQSGAKEKTLFEKFKGNKMVSRLTKVMGKLNLNAPIHLIDSVITYAIGVISGMQDMAQVEFILVLFLIQSTTSLLLTMSS